MFTLCNRGDPEPDAPVAIIGAGTGLGQGFAIKEGNYRRVFPSEGGHADFAPPLRAGVSTAALPAG